MIIFPGTTLSSGGGATATSTTRSSRSGARCVDVSFTPETETALKLSRAVKPSRAVRPGGPRPPPPPTGPPTPHPPTPTPPTTLPTTPPTPTPCCPARRTPPSQPHPGRVARYSSFEVYFGVFSVILAGRPRCRPSLSAVFGPNRTPFGCEYFIIIFNGFRSSSPFSSLRRSATSCRSRVRWLRRTPGL